jgi:hypothetical protein
MARINLTKKPVSEQLRILNDYLNRRAQHKSQDEVTIDQLLKRFRNNRCFTNKSKAVWLSKLLKDVKSMSKIAI